jgi:hydroxylamine reductase (hybrid-cluster protein)
LIQIKRVRCIVNIKELLGLSVISTPLALVINWTDKTAAT